MRCRASARDRRRRGRLKTMPTNISRKRARGETLPEGPKDEGTMDLKAEVQDEVQAQGAAGDSDGDETDGSSSGDATSSHGCSMKHTAPKMLAERQSQHANQAKNASKNSPVTPTPPAHHARCPNRLYQHQC